MKRLVCIHGHFYQPPRENPWLEVVEVEDSAAPFHDWNERVHAECYRANASARVLDDAGRVRAIRDNYRRLSFDAGPTLLAWLERQAPEDHARIVAADRASRERFAGHGSAMAQAYNHMILPLASARDIRTQVRWGLADFRRRFQRAPEALWLPETAVDLRTLEALAEAGLTYALLAPHQAARVRPIGSTEWQAVRADTLVTGRAYRATLPSGRSLTLFFYDGPTSRAVAFEGLLDDGRRLATRLIERARALPDDAPLEHIATDGESYGHHHRFGEMALAAALEAIEASDEVELTTYGAFLEAHPPTWEVEIHERTSWSCAHGVERWRSDCGCATGAHPEWQQAWRGPLRSALDWLRDEVAARTERVAERLVHDPWAARDAWIDVILDRDPEHLSAFLEAHARGRLGARQVSDLACLMEAQRHTLLMYTSCGWFFDDPSGLETRQILRYASRVVQLAGEVLGPTLEPAFEHRLEEGRSNRPEIGSLAAIYREEVRRSRVGLADVAAHYAVSALFRRGEAERRIFSYTVEPQQVHERRLGDAALSLQRVKVRSNVTLRERTFDVGVVHFGDHNLSASVHAPLPDESWRRLRSEAEAAFEGGDLPGVVRLFDARLGATVHSLASLFRDERRRVLERVLAGPLREADTTLRGLYRGNAGLLRFLHRLEVPLPVPLEAAAAWVLESDLVRALQRDPPDSEAALETDRAAAALDLALPAERSAAALQAALEAALPGLRPGDIEGLERVHAILELGEALALPLDLLRLQEALSALAPAVEGAGEAWRERTLTLFERAGLSTDPLPTIERAGPPAKETTP